MEIGQMNFKVMSILDAGETGKIRSPDANLRLNVKATAGKCILISVTISKISTTCWNRPKAWALMFTPTAKCCLRMVTGAA